MNKNGSKVITEFTAKNTINELSINWSWDCTNGVSSSLPFNMSSNEDLLVIMEHNYSLSSPNLSCSVHSADGNESRFKKLGGVLLTRGAEIAQIASLVIQLLALSSAAK